MHDARYGVPKTPERAEGLSEVSRGLDEELSRPEGPPMMIREILRTGHVTRWHIVRTHREQTLAEHHYLVTMIAMDMARILGFKDHDTTLLMYWCLHHDLPEVLTGDVPTPSKMVIKKHLDYDVTIDDATSKQFATLRRGVVGTYIDEVAKLADIMEAVIFLKNEGVRVDDPTTHVHRVYAGIIQSYRRAVVTAAGKFPEFPWHLLVDYREEVEESPVRQMVLPDAAGG